MALLRRRLDALVTAEVPAEREPREASHRRALHAARLEPERNQRPPVEALLHHLVPGRLVLHPHATVANALCCCAGGDAIAVDLFREAARDGPSTGSRSGSRRLIRS